MSPQVGTLSPQSSFNCTRPNLHNVCSTLKALVLAETAKDRVQQYIFESTVTPQAWLSALLDKVSDSEGTVLEGVLS